MAGTVDTTGSATHVEGLTGVLLHVGALDLDAPRRAVVEDHVEVTLGCDRLVVLGDLVVLRLIRVEVVLACESAPRRDGAVERKADPDRGLDSGCVHHRQRTGHAQTDRAHLGIGFGTELGGARAEHLGRGAEFYVHLHTHHRLVLGQYFVVIEDVGRIDSSHGDQFMRLRLSRRMRLPPRSAPWAPS